jgi:hypothetical protein
MPQGGRHMNWLIVPVNNEHSESQGCVERVEKFKL